MNTVSQWSWPDSLALVVTGDTVKVEEFLFTMVRNHCQELGIEEGSILTCRTQDGSWLELQKDDGQTARLPREYAWFIAVGGV